MTSSSLINTDNYNNFYGSRKNFHKISNVFFDLVIRDNEIFNKFVGILDNVVIGLKMEPFYSLSLLRPPGHVIFEICHVCVCVFIYLSEPMCST